MASDNPKDPFGEGTEASAPYSLDGLLDRKKKNKTAQQITKSSFFMFYIDLMDITS